MSSNNNRQGSILVKFDEATEIELAILAIKMGKKRVSKNGKTVLVDHSKADAVVEVVRRALAGGQTEEVGSAVVGNAGDRPAER